MSIAKVNFSLSLHGSLMNEWNKNIDTRFCTKHNCIHLPNCREYLHVTKSILCFRYRLSEISFVLKAVATLIISMKKAPPAKGKTNKKLFLFFYKILKKSFSWTYCLGTIDWLISILGRLYHNQFTGSVSISAWSINAVQWSTFATIQFNKHYKRFI